MLQDFKQIQQRSFRYFALQSSSFFPLKPTLSLPKGFFCSLFRREYGKEVLNSKRWLDPGFK